MTHSSDKKSVRKFQLNPLVKKGLRERLRRKQMIAWGLFTLILTSFVYLIAYINGSDQHWLYEHEVDPAVANANGAKTAFPFLLVVQGFILMFLGTGNVAAGTAEEREAGLLDYQRMTPMNPFSKITGYVFGLPGREYYMFALTLPFLAHATIVGGLSVTKVLHLYVVFLSCVLLYHLTAHVTGLIVRKPRAASWFSRLVVLALYVFLPALGQVGFSFLSFLTLLPTYLGIMSKELRLSWQEDREPHASITDSHLEAAEAGMEEPWANDGPPPMEYRSREEFSASDFWSEVPFFETTISPSLFTVLMQGLLLAGLIAAAHRKWRNESMPAFSKPFGIGLFHLLQVLLLGSLWQLYGEGKASGLLGNAFSQNNFNFDDDGAGGVLILVQSVLFTLSLLASVLIINVTCPTRHQYLKGKRRSAKLGLPDIPLLNDEKPGWLITLSLVAFMSLTHCILLSRAVASGLYFTVRPELEVYYLPCLFFAACVVYVRAARERWFTLGFWGFLGLLWITPLLLSMLLAVAGDGDASAGIYYVGSLSPPFAFFEISVRAHDLQVDPEEGLMRAAALFGTMVACLIALLLSIAQYLMRRGWDQGEEPMQTKETE